MKKIFMTSIFLFLSFGVFSQMLGITNALSCDVTVKVRAHDNCTYGSCDALLSVFTIPANTTYSWSDPTGFNYTAPAYTGIVWSHMDIAACSSGACGYTCGWDAVQVEYGSCSVGVQDVSACAGFGQTIPFLCCSGTSVTWVNDGYGNIKVTIQ